MIELSGTRYAVGKRTSTAMWVVTWLAILCFTCFLADRIIAIATLYVGLPEWTMLGIYIALTLYALSILAAWLVILMLMSCDKQTVDAAMPRGWKNKLRASEVLIFLRSPVFLITVLALSSLAVSTQVFANQANVWVLVAAIMAIASLMAWDIVVLWRLSQRMTRQASILVDGEVDECRGFDWERLNVGAEERFRSRFRDRRWKFPGRIKYSAEAHRYARKARENRIGWTVFNAVLALLLVAVVNQPVISFVKRIAHQMSDLDQQPIPPTNYWTVAGNSLLLVLLLIPVMLQSRSNDFDALATIYEDRAKELEEPEAQPVDTRLAEPAKKRGTLSSALCYAVPAISVYLLVSRRRHS
jgi:hypothetical protein